MASCTESLDFIEIELDQPDDIELLQGTIDQNLDLEEDTQIDQKSQQHTNLATPNEIGFPPNDQNAKQDTNLDLPPDEIDFPSDEIESDNELSNSSNSDPTPNLDDYELEFEPNTTNHSLPSYNITNFPMSNLEHDDPALLLLDEKDDIIGWKYEHTDSGPTDGPFLKTCRTPIQDPNGNPEVFFNELFDECMWSTIAQATNACAQCKTITPTGNRCSDPQIQITKDIVI